MTAKLILINNHRPMQDLVEIRFSRTHDGSIFATVIHSDPEWMEEVSMLSLAERFETVVGIVEDGIPSLVNQSQEHMFPEEELEMKNQEPVKKKTFFGRMSEAVKIFTVGVVVSFIFGFLLWIYATSA